MAAHHQLPRAALESLLEAPETYQLLFGEYNGPVSLGLSVDETTGEQCLLVRIADAEMVRRDQLDVDGHTIRVIVRTPFRSPVAG